MPRKRYFNDERKDTITDILNFFTDDFEESFSHVTLRQACQPQSQWRAKSMKFVDWVGAKPNLKKDIILKIVTKKNTVIGQVYFPIQ